MPEAQKPAPTPPQKSTIKTVLVILLGVILLIGTIYAVIVSMFSGAITGSGLFGTQPTAKDYVPLYGVAFGWTALVLYLIFGKFSHKKTSIIVLGLLTIFSLGVFMILFM